MRIKSALTSRNPSLLRLAMLRSVCSVFLGVFLVVHMPAQTKAQPTAVCADHKPLALQVVTALITQNRDHDDRTVRRIQACQVSFQLDAPSLDKLSTVQASDAVMDALNEVTAAKLTSEQAHAQVADLAAKADLADKSRAAKKSISYRARIAYLEQSTYTDPRELKYVHYDADRQRLSASLGGEEYWFEQLPANSAQTLHDNWAKVRATQTYQEDATHTRTLKLEAVLAPGMPRAIAEPIFFEKVRKMNADAQTRMNRNDFDGALSGYRAVLGIDPDNADAKAGLVAVQTARQVVTEKQTQFLQGLEPAGIWLDPASSTKLMWTIKDSDQTVNWQQATDYCQALRLDDLSNWRLPTIPELKSIYDPSILRHLKNGFGGFYFRLREPIRVRSSELWSSEQKGEQKALSFDPVVGSVEQAETNSKMGMRALCVRNFNPATDGLTAKP